MGLKKFSSRLHQSLPFEKVQHQVTTLDAQPSSPTIASLIVSVTGLLLVRTDDVLVSSDHYEPATHKCRGDGFF